VNRYWLFRAFAILVAACVAAPLEAQLRPEYEELALGLVPVALRDGARLFLSDGGDLRPVRHSDGPFTCVTDVSDPTRVSFSCYHEDLHEFLELQEGMVAEGLRGAAFQEQLCDRMRSQGIAIPSPRLLVTMNVALGPDGELPDAATVWHLLQMPEVTSSSSGLAEEEPYPGGPWLHNGGTCDAHLMWSERRSIGDR
jgi:hypothetical protein